MCPWQQQLTTQQTATHSWLRATQSDRAARQRRAAVSEPTHRSARRLTRNAVEAEDLVEETMLRAYA